MQYYCIGINNYYEIGENCVISTLKAQNINSLK